MHLPAVVRFDRGFVRHSSAKRCTPTTLRNMGRHPPRRFYVPRQQSSFSKRRIRGGTCSSQRRNRRPRFTLLRPCSFAAQARGNARREEGATFSVVARPRAAVVLRCGVSLSSSAGSYGHLHSPSGRSLTFGVAAHRAAATRRSVLRLVPRPAIRTPQYRNIRPRAPHLRWKSLIPRPE